MEPQILQLSLEGLVRNERSLCSPPSAPLLPKSRQLKVQICSKVFYKEGSFVPTVRNMAALDLTLVLRVACGVRVRHEEVTGVIRATASAAGARAGPLETKFTIGYPFIERMDRYMPEVDFTIVDKGLLTATLTFPLAAHNEAVFLQFWCYNAVDDVIAFTPISEGFLAVCYADASRRSCNVLGWPSPGRILPEMRPPPFAPISKKSTVNGPEELLMRLRLDLATGGPGIDLQTTLATLAALPLLPAPMDASADKEIPGLDTNDEDDRALSNDAISVYGWTPSARKKSGCAPEPDGPNETSLLNLGVAAHEQGIPRVSTEPLDSGHAGALPLGGELAASSLDFASDIEVGKEADEEYVNPFPPIEACKELNLRAVADYWFGIEESLSTDSISHREPLNDP